MPPIPNPLLLLPYRRWHLETRYSSKEVIKRLSNDLPRIQGIVDKKEKALFYTLIDLVAGHDLYWVEINGNSFKLQKTKHPIWIDRSLPIEVTGELRSYGKGSCIELKITYPLVVTLSILLFLASGLIWLALSGFVSWLWQPLVTLLFVWYGIAIGVFYLQALRVRRTLKALLTT
jgi:hypothetical protein